MDAISDEKVQELICNSLPGVTVMSVMHRFDAIESYDRIILIDGGQVIEDGTPTALLADPLSRFSRLYRHEQQDR
jgi:ABC-type multidrug transport system fused ATPase/permease subunit